MEADLSTGTGGGALGSVDPIWVLVSAPPPPSGPPYGPGAFTTSSTAWLAVPSGHWIQPVNSATAGSASMGNYKYQVQFAINNPLQYSSISLTSQYSADNDLAAGSVRLNTTALAVSCATTCFTMLHPATPIVLSTGVPIAQPFVSGVNTLEATVTNQGSLTGLLVNAKLSAQCAQRQSVSTYAAKFICGVQPDADVTHIPDAQAGRYSTKINVHNNTGNVINFRKKIIRLRGGQVPIEPQFKVFESLRPDYGMEVVCRDIYEHLHIVPPSGTIPRYIEGFVIFEVYFETSLGRPIVPPADALDVIGVYTYKGDLPATPTTPSSGSGVSIEVVVYPAKNNRHLLD